MVTMVVNFDKEKLKESGYTAEQLLGQFDKYCVAKQIKKPQYNVFEKDGEHGLALIGNIMYEITYNDTIFHLLKSWYWDIDGEREDLLNGSYEWKHRAKP